MKVLTVLVTTLTLTGFVMAAQPGEDDPKKTFKKLDQDKNGTLNMEEAGTGGITSSSFTQLDANADKALDWQEFLALYKDGSDKKPTSDRK